MNLKEYKEVTGLSYKDLAKLLQVTIPTIFNWMYKKRTPHPKNAERVLRVTGGNVDLNSHRWKR